MHNQIGGEGQPDKQVAGTSGGKRAKEHVGTILALPVAANIAELAKRQSDRKFYMVSQHRINSACESYIVRLLGCGRDADEASRQANWEQARVLRAAVESNGEHQFFNDEQLDAVLPDCLDVIISSAKSREIWDIKRVDNEIRMAALARTLPVYEWVKSVKGIKDFSLAKIVGEAGSLSDYATKEKVWKRLGVAVIDGQRQQRVTGTVAAERHGYNPLRRSELWIICDPLLRAQWRGAKDDLPARPIGPYGVVYGRRKAHTAALNEAGHYAERALGFVVAAQRAGKTPAKENLEGQLTKKHLDNDARRIMSKALIEDLWRVWRGLQPLCGALA